MEQLRADSAHRFLTPTDLAVAHVALGDTDAAFAALGSAREARDAWFPWIRCLPLLDDLRADPRFDRLLAQMR